MKSKNQIFKKYLGQNFLVDGKVIEMMVGTAEVNNDDLVIEIGAGTGNLTQAIAEKAGKVVTFEIDKDLIPMLEKNLGDFGNVRIINQDVLKTDFEKLKIENWKLEIKIIGSIPYSITSPLIHKILFSKIVFKAIVLLIQQEVAKKICGQPPKASYLSNLVASCARAEIVQKVAPSVFRPQPRVNSAIIKIEKYKNCDKEFSEFLHQGFVYQRKIMKRKFDEELLRVAEIDPKMRAQELKPEDWKKLFQKQKIKN